MFKWLSVLLVLFVGCDESIKGLDESGLPDSDDPFYQSCVDRINEFRSTEDLPPLERNLEQEDCASRSAAEDAASNTAHGSFQQCGEWAQNECPGYPSVESTLKNCIQAMWDEKELGDVPFEQNGHYKNMSSTNYTQVACGYYITADSSVWMIQNFY